MDPEISFSQSVCVKANKLFSLVPTYVSPITLNYKLPEAHAPEFAFVGRSNVGKSSLISALMGDVNKLVKISKTPGCTKMINYFKFAHKDGPAVLYFIDLPGYGFAKAGKQEQEKWKQTMKLFLKSRDFTILKRVYILIDARHPIKTSDVEMMNLLLDAKLSYQIILTKSDLVGPKDLESNIETAFREILSRKDAW